ncbi:hypothetical protein BDZ97DRAFT_2060797 [Flammula alnicola]|nr:hypothetical protein BDZ97DRAFT_2060797 [Flammula alnicola]
MIAPTCEGTLVRGRIVEEVDRSSSDSHLMRGSCGTVVGDIAVGNGHELAEVSQDLIRVCGEGEGPGSDAADAGQAPPTRRTRILHEKKGGTRDAIDREGAGVDGDRCHWRMILMLNLDEANALTVISVGKKMREKLDTSQCCQKTRLRALSNILRQADEICYSPLGRDWEEKWAEREVDADEHRRVLSLNIGSSC